MYAGRHHEAAIFPCFAACFADRSDRFVFFLGEPFIAGRIPPETGIVVQIRDRAVTVALAGTIDTGKELVETR